MTTAQPLSTSRPAIASGVLARTSSGAALIYAAYALAVCVLFWPTLSVMAQTWFESSAYHHGALVAPIAIWMMARKGLGDNARPSLFAVIGVLGAAIVWLLGRVASVNVVEQVGVVSLLIAGAAVVLGISGFRRLAFPLLFLYFMVPIGSIATPALQEITADSAVALLNLSGISAAIDGFLITTSAGKYEIAEACAGLNFLLAALMVAAVYAWFAFASRRKAAAFLAFAVALAVLANVARAYVVILAATITNGKYSIGADHIVFGWVFYGLLLFALIAVGRRFADDRSLNAFQNPKDPNTCKLGGRGIAAMAAAVTINVAVAGYVYAVMERASPISLPNELPLINAPGWRVAAPFPSWRASLDKADRSLQVSYQNDISAVQLAAGYFAYDRRGAEIGGEVAAADKSGWRRIGVRAVTAKALGARREFSVTTLEDPWNQRLDVATLYWLDSEVFPDATALKIRVALERLRGKRSRGGVFYIAAPADGVGALPRPISQFLTDAEPLSAWLARIDAKPTN